MRRPWLIAAALAVTISSAPALANDSSAELRQGGLVLVRNPGIDMRSEDLFISEGVIRVRYRFLNATSKAQTVWVAFPMPDITIAGPDENISVPTEDPANFLGFRTRVEGRPVSARAEQRVFRGGVDRTALLRSLGVPLAPHLPATARALDRLPKAIQQRLLKLNLAIPDDYDAGKGWEHHLQPTWTLKTSYYWRQTFPAGRELAVEHEYTPSVGATAGTALELADFLKSGDFRAMQRKYCIDQDFMAALARAKREAGPDRQAFVEKRIDYVLSSGANWRRPIGSFRLVVDKGRPDSLVSFCAEGVRKVGPTRFEVDKTDFRPTRDLSILILERLR